MHRLQLADPIEITSLSTKGEKYTVKWKLALTAAVLAACVSVVLPPEGNAQNSAKQGTLEKIKVHGKALEGNLEGDSPDRDVFVYLPASYASSPNSR